MKTIYNNFFLLLLTFVISACGYQLRGSAALEGLENINIISNGYTNVSRLLKQRLGSVKGSSQNNNDYPVIRLIRVSSQKRQLSVNSSGRADEYEISKSLNYEVALSETLKFSDTLTARASYDFNESQMQGTKEQELIANNVIDRILVRKLLQRLKSAVKSSTSN